ncbi:MAG: inositol 2-dehydrogenase [Promethearchaeota archaeon]
MTEKINVGVIGAGRIGQLHIENIVHNIPGFNIKTVAEIMLDKNPQLKQKLESLGIKNLTTNYKEILEDPDIKAVIICSSTDTHAQFIIESAEAGKDIFCEKPIHYDLDKIKEALNAIKKAKVKLQIGFNRRYDHNFKRVRQAVEDGTIGIPHIIKITSRDPAPPPIEYIKVSGGLFNDMTIHDWDMARYIGGKETGEIVEVYAMGGVLVDEKIGSEGGDIDTCAVVLKYENGAMALIDNSRQAIYGYDQRVEAFGTKGMAKAENDTPNRVEIYTESSTQMDKIPYFFLDRYMQSYTDEMKEFYNCLIENKEPSCNGYDGLMAVVIAKAALKSLKENRPVKIKEII